MFTDPYTRYEMMSLCYLHNVNQRLFNRQRQLIIASYTTMLVFFTILILKYDQ